MFVAMNRFKITLFILSVSLIGCTLLNGPVVSVWVREPLLSLETIKKLNEIELIEFQKFWRAKKKTHMRPFVKEQKHYLLDMDGRHGGRWVYYPDGYVEVVGVLDRSSFMISNPDAFNKLIGIEK